jgi:hypothetical protein
MVNSLRVNIAWGIFDIFPLWLSLFECQLADIIAIVRETIRSFCWEFLYLLVYAEGDGDDDDDANADDDDY